MSEFAFIERIRARAAQSYRTATELTLGIGDDTAIFQPRPGHELLVTTDLLVEDVDFKLSYAVPRWLGHKVLHVSLSDIAAMGGQPRYALLSLAIPAKSSLASASSSQFWEEFFDGYFAAAESCGVTLIGGDISATPHGLALDSCVIGACPTGAAVRRNGARVGDAIYVTGEIGGSTAGLQLLLGGAQVDQTAATLAQAALRRHLRPQAQVEFGQRLGASGLAHALIDVSDGLAQDLAHLCRASGVSAELDLTVIPVAASVALLADTRAEQVQLALNGGEDYELLFTAAADAEPALQQLAQACAVPLTRLGVIRAARAEAPVFIRHADELVPLSSRGFDHFSRD